jgi:hypothetical protein
MRLFHSDSLLTTSTNKQLIEGTIKGLWIRYTGTNQTGQTLTVANLGTVRVNVRGTDIVNVPVSFLSNMNNLFWGAAEASSTISAAFAFTVYVPFHAPWDSQNGIFVQIEDNPYIQLNYSGVTGTIIASGTVEVYAVLANQVARYIPLWNQQNVQVGGAGRATQRLQNFNISSLFIETNAQLTTVLVNKDNKSVISANQNVLLAKSNLENEVETSITTYEVCLNPFRRIEEAVASLIEVDFTLGATTTVVMYFLAFLFDDDMRMRSANYVATLAPAVKAQPIALNPGQPTKTQLVQARVPLSSQ